MIIGGKKISISVSSTNCFRQARSRVIPTAEGKALAKSIDAKFIETSSGIQHNVDELLVGVLKQVSEGKPNVQPFFNNICVIE